MAVLAPRYSDVLLLLYFIFMLLVHTVVVDAKISSCACDSAPTDFWYGWSCNACSCPSNYPYDIRTSDPDTCENDRCNDGQYVCCTDNEEVDLLNANTDRTCGRLVYTPVRKTCSWFSCATYNGCGTGYDVVVSGCGCGCSQTGLTAWEIALIVLAGILVSIIAAIILWKLVICLSQRRRQRENAPRETEMPTSAGFSETSWQPGQTMYGQQDIVYGYPISSPPERGPLAAGLPSRVRPLVEDWNSGQVSAWLISCGFDETAVLLFSGINGKDLLSLSRSELIDDFHLTKSDITKLRNELIHVTDTTA